MKKSHLILFVAGGLIAIGMILSYTGATFIAQQISITETIVNGTAPAELTKELSPEITEKGAFVVRAEEFEKTRLVANVYGPSGESLASKEITQVSTEEYFDISTEGQYKLVVQNMGSQDIPIVIGLTHMPDRSLVAINLLGQSMIVSGFAGVGIAGLVAIKSRKKSS
ncbi:MAG: hypothetical protein HZC29_04445 [Thaumarchaeota archaeon]|nr:hypothetical protein [Nitrososphaerota archaeon]